MADADGHDAAKAVEVAFARVVPQILHAPLHEHERLFVVKEDAGVHELLAQRRHCIGGRAGIFLRFVTAGGQRDVLHK